MFNFVISVKESVENGHRTRYYLYFCLRNNLSPIRLINTESLVKGGGTGSVG
jgi:hypothetical protein